MNMTPGEIRANYLRSTNRRHQLTILAELNACSKSTIKKILLDEGVPESDIPNFRLPKEEQMSEETEEVHAIRQMPQIVKQVLEHKREALLSNIAEIDAQINVLKSTEDKLAEQYAEISDYLKCMS